MSDLEILIKVPFPSNRHAEIAYDVLRLDAEPRRNHVEKSLIVEGNLLVVNFSGGTAKALRTGLTSFFDNLLLSCETMEAFGPPSTKYNHY
ncbi:EKC/KEOPS complex subunit LAGE3 [Lutzomyia longipalpis]|uniref:EKC/KEOPS complex subunit LAGE3 n=1 Tax=Lutzomyia longipalpis TaxID=7200 RepID=UPI002483DF66|nr:EKC/KEOPS complex subunit LAGE3 [Lutzomyia longipalpis]